MKCEHAQEFFSEYIEKSLDKPSGVALEAHLTACGHCRRELEGLQQTWGALNAVPVVEPPADLAWRVMCQLQEEKLQRLEAEEARKRKNPFLGWLQSLTPGAAFGYATLVALLILGVAFPLVPKGPIFGLFGREPVVATSVDLHPLVDIAAPRQDAPDHWIMPLVVTTVPQFGQSTVTATPLVLRDREWAEVNPAGIEGMRQVLPAGDTRSFPVPVIVGGEGVLAVRVRVQSPRQTITQDVLVVPSR